MNKQRRKELEKALNLLADARQIIEGIRDEEQEAYDNLPDGIRDSERGEQMDEYVCTLDEAVSEIENREDELNEIIYG